MMEEVAIAAACDDCTAEQISEDEILACLVAEMRPKAKVPKKTKLKEGEDQSKEGNEDPIDKYQRENQQLLQASLRLEQENDSLAHRLVTSKIALRTSLDKAEDRVDDLTEQLLQNQLLLKTSEEQIRGKDQEAERLKEMFRRELQNAEQQVKKSSGIVADYKQICSQLTSRLEEQQTAHREETEALKSVVKACPSCCHLLEPPRGREEEAHGDGEGEGDRITVAAATEVPAGGAPDAEQYEAHSRLAERRREEQRRRQEKEALGLQIRGLEKELAQTKLLMVEAKCTIQELQHQNGILSSDLQAAGNSWFSKTFLLGRASGGGLHGYSMPRDGPPQAAWAGPGGALAGWSPKRPLWLHK
ncbi:unnamed protein product [Merluccius merluccius]